MEGMNNIGRVLSSLLLRAYKKTHQNRHVLYLLILYEGISSFL